MRALALAALPLAFLTACCTDGAPAPAAPPGAAPAAVEAGSGQGTPAGAQAGAAVQAPPPGGAAAAPAPPAHSAVPAGTCRRTGCAGEICAADDRASPCIMKPEFACYVAGRCERQADGACGWTQDAALQRCLAEKRAANPGDRLP